MEAIRQEALNPPVGTPLSHRRKSGSETRQMQKRTTVRWPGEEYTTLEEAADAAGLTVGSYIRECCLKAPKTRKRRRPSVEVQTLAGILAQVRKMGSNVHQTLKHLNFGEVVLRDEFDDSLKSIDKAAAMVMKELGRVAS